MLMVRVLPDEEEFHEEELKPVYKGIYVRQKLLFEGEVMEYTISEYENGEPVEKASGRISCGKRPPGTGEIVFPPSIPWDSVWL